MFLFICPESPPSLLWVALRALPPVILSLSLSSFSGAPSPPSIWLLCDESTLLVGRLLTPYARQISPSSLHTFPMARWVLTPPTVGEGELIQQNNNKKALLLMTLYLNRLVL